MEAVIIGVGLHPFGRFGGKSAMDMATDAVRAALADAGIGWPQVQAGFVGSLEVANPDAIVGKLGLTGVPLRGVFNGCATAGTAVGMAARAIETGEHDLTIAIGMDKHPRGAFAADPSVAGLPAWYGQTGLFLTTHFFGMKINRYMHDHGISRQTLARVAAKNFRNASGNEKAWRRTPLSGEEILASPVLNYPLTQYMYCGPDEGAGAVVLCRADQAHRYTSRPVRVRACVLRSRRLGAFEVQAPSMPAPSVLAPSKLAPSKLAPSKLAAEHAPSPTVDASRAAYQIAGIGPEDVAVAQLQDTDAGSEIIHMAENGLCKDGEQERMIAEGETEIGGRLPVNTDGGLMGNGEPIGASGLRQIHELVLQLRGTAGARQVPGAPAVGYAHLYGSPGVSAVTILST
jgi:acetyl-CoA acetyltransferase